MTTDRRATGCIAPVRMRCRKLSLWVPRIVTVFCSRISLTSVQELAKLAPGRCRKLSLAENPWSEICEITGQYFGISSAYDQIMTMTMTASDITAAAARVTGLGRFGQQAYVISVYGELKPAGWTLAAFKAELARLHCAGELVLARADWFPTSHSVIVEASEVRHMGATWHRVCF